MNEFAKRYAKQTGIINFDIKILGGETPIVTTTANVTYSHIYAMWKDDYVLKATTVPIKKVKN